MLDKSADDTTVARGRALSSPLRLRILRLCLHQSRTNKEIADALGLNPATTLHHVRTLVQTGLLLAQEQRIGKRGAREIPYLASRLSWRAPVEDVAPILIDTFLQEIQGLEPADIQVWRLGIKLNPARQQEMLERFRALAEEYARGPADADGVPTSILFAHHVDRAGTAGQGSGPRSRSGDAADAGSARTAPPQAE